MATVSKSTKLLTTADAAKVLGVSIDSAHALILASRLQTALSLADCYMDDEKDLAKVKVRKPGRPQTTKK